MSMFCERNSLIFRSIIKMRLTTYHPPNRNMVDSVGLSDKNKHIENIFIRFLICVLAFIAFGVTYSWGSQNYFSSSLEQTVQSNKGVTLPLSL